MLVKEAMEEQLVVLDPEDSLGHAIVKLVGADCPGAAVVDCQGSLVGFLNLSALLSGMRIQQKRFKILLPPEVPYGVGFAEEVRQRDAHQAFAELFHQPVASRMRKKVPTVESSQGVEKAVKAMVESGVYELPVLDGGQVVGVISQASILRAMALAVVATPTALVEEQEPSCPL